jgi:hypothetical protein
MRIRAHFRLKPLIIGSAIIGAFVLGAVFGHLKPWQRRAGLSAEDIRGYNEILDHMRVIPRALARCKAAGITVPKVPSEPFGDDDRRGYVMLCMQGEGFEYDSTAKALTGQKCEVAGYHGDYESERCYRRMSP